MGRLVKLPAELLEFLFKNNLSVIDTSDYGDSKVGSSEFVAAQARLNESFRQRAVAVQCEPIRVAVDDCVLPRRESDTLVTDNELSCAICTGRVVEVDPLVTDTKQHVAAEQLRRFTTLMESDPNGIDPRAGGAKLDAGKVRPSLILSDMPRALLAIAKVGTFGANKYSDGGWLEVKDGVKRYDDAADRHRLKRCIEGEFDLDSHLLHRAHQAWNDIAALELYLRAKEGAK